MQFCQPAELEVRNSGFGLNAAVKIAWYEAKWDIVKLWGETACTRSGIRNRFAFHIFPKKYDDFWLDSTSCRAVALAQADRVFDPFLRKFAS